MPAMPLPEPYEEADDAALVDGCTAHDEDAWRALADRHGRLIDAVVVRALDERPGAPLVDAPVVAKAVIEHLQRNQAASLVHWGGACDLRTYIAVVARRVATSDGADKTPVASLIAGLPTPAELFLDDIATAKPAKDVTDTLDKLPPNVMALVRLRLRGLNRAQIAATLGLPQPVVLAHLERIAQRIGEIQEGDSAWTTLAWHLLLDVSSPTDRVRAAVRTEDDASFRAIRSKAESTWRAVRERVLPVPHARGANCLDDRSVAAFVDGSVRGAARARAEGHLVTCTLCIDHVATLATDLRVLEPLRATAQIDRGVALAAALIATARFRAAEVIGQLAAQRGAKGAHEVVRIAQVGKALMGGPSREPITPSRVIETRSMPSDEEAPLVALEALVTGDAHAAATAIDDHTAKQRIGARLRLLAAAAGDDTDGAHLLAAAIRARPHVDTDLSTDAEMVLALPPDHALPREILVERLRDALPEAIHLL